MSCINPEDKVWRAISYFYHDIVKFLIDKCEDKKSMKILLHDAVTLQADLASRLPKTADFAAKDFCFDFSVSFVSCFAGK
jgi:hypothetical protein